MIDDEETSGAGMGVCPSDDVIDLIAGGGAPTTEVQAHLDGCARCRAEIAAVREGEQFLSGYLAAPLGGATAREDELDIPPDLLPGYRMLSLIHSGGQGVVYKALQEATGRTVAVKMLLAGRFATAAQRRRFEREAEVAAALDHPGIVRIFDSRAVRGGRHALIMEYVEGVPLDEWSPPARNERERIRAWMSLFVEVCDAVEHAHRNGVIHRDLKPSNVLVDRAGRARVVDFGIARPTRADGPTITETGEFAGSLEYASPEQVLEAREGSQNIRADARSDIYSIGVMLYGRLCGKPPYAGDGSILDVIHSIVETAPARPSLLNRAIDLDAETILLHALQKERVRRYSTAGALGADLQQYLKGQAIEARRDSGLYVLRKTVRRYRIHLAVIAALLSVPVMMYIARAEQAKRRLASEHYTNIANDSSVDFGRMFCGQRHGPAGEGFLWSALLDTFAVPRTAEQEGMVRRDALWALREMYAHDPCDRTVALGGAPIAAVVVHAANPVLRWIERSGAIVTVALPEFADRRTVQVEERLSDDCVFSPTGRVVVSWGSGRVVFLDAETGRSIGGCEGSCAVKTLPAVSLDDRRVAWVGEDGVVRVAGVGGGNVVEPQPLFAESGKQAAVCWMRRGLLALGCDGVLRVWDGEIGAAVQLGPKLGGDGAAVAISTADTTVSMTASDDGEAVGLVVGGRAWVWNTGSAEPTLVEVPVGNGQSVLAMTAPAAGVERRIVTAGLRQRLQLWESLRGQPLRDLVGHTAPVVWMGGVRLGPSGDGVVSIDADGKAKLWWLDRPCAASVEAMSSARVIALAFSGQDRLLACAADGSTSSWRIGPDGAAVAAIKEKDLVNLAEPFSAVAIHPRTGRMAIGHADGTVVIHEMAGMRVLGRTEPGAESVRAIAWNTEGTMLAACGADGAVRWWLAAPGEPMKLRGSVKPDPETAKTLMGVSFSADSQNIVVATDRGTLIRLGAESGEVRDVAATADAPIGAVAAAPDASFYATAVGDGIALRDQDWFPGLLCWIAGQSAGEWRLRSNAGVTFSSVAVSANARFVAAGDDRGGVHIWDLWAFDASILGNLAWQVGERKPFQTKIDESELRAWADVNLRHKAVEPTAGSGK